MIYCPGWKIHSFVWQQSFPTHYKWKRWADLCNLRAFNTKQKRPYANTRVDISGWHWLTLAWRCRGYPQKAECKLSRESRKLTLQSLWRLVCFSSVHHVDDMEANSSPHHDGLQIQLLVYHCRENTFHERLFTKEIIKPDGYHKVYFISLPANWQVVCPPSAHSRLPQINCLLMRGRHHILWLQTRRQEFSELPQLQQSDKHGSGFCFCLTYIYTYQPLYQVHPASTAMDPFSLQNPNPLWHRLN